MLLPLTGMAATASLSIEDFSIKAGEEKEMVINLTNPNDIITLVQFDLSLPAGLSVKKVDGDYDIDIAGRTTWKKHSLDANAQADGSIRLLMASSSNTALSGTEGAIIKMTLVADGTFNKGDIKLNNILLVTPDEKEIAKNEITYYIDNSTPIPWVDIIVNGDMEGESMECFYVTEQGIGGPFVAVATDGIGKDGGKAVKVQSADSPAQDWDSQFFIRLPYQLSAGIKYHVSFDYKANKAGDFETLTHAEPGDYIHWACIGSGSFTTEWQTYEKEGTISSDMNISMEGEPMQTIAFNLAKNKVATEFIFDNVKFEVEESVVATLTKNPAVNPKPYPVLPVTTGTAKLSIDQPFEIAADSEAEMIIELTNPDNEITLVQFDLQLPEGLSIKKVDGDYDIDIAGRTTWKKHSLDANVQTDGSIRFLMASSSNTALSGTEGAIIKMTLVANNSFTGGDVKIENILLVTPDEKEITPDAVTHTIPAPVPPPTPKTAKLSIEEPFCITAGGEAEMIIELTNPDDEITLVQFDLQLPEGLSIKKVDGDYDIDIAGRTTWKKHSLDANAQADGSIRFLLASSSNTVLSGTEGAIIKVMLVANNNYEGGNIKMENILLVTPSENEIQPQDVIINGISNLADERISSSPIFSLSGQCLVAPKKGINIICGKKVVVK